MTDKAPITTIDEARAALDEEIASSASMLVYHERDHLKAKAAFEATQFKHYALKVLRERMNPVQPVATVIDEDFL